MARHLNDTRPFHFKQFSMHHHKSSMKIGTDSILLSAWVDLESVESALDIGSGSGIISLLLASRCEAVIDTVEIDAASVLESSDNFKSSKFNKRLSVKQMDFVEYATSCNKFYDLIVSNPPFFTDYSFKPTEESRMNARHNEKLGFEALCEYTSKLLQPNGKFCLVLPKAEEANFLKIASLFKLHLQKTMTIYPKKSKEANRVNMQLGFEKKNKVQIENFTIRENDHTFTRQYIDLLKDHYIDLE